MKIAFGKIALPSEGAIAVGVLEGRVLTAFGKELDHKTGGAVTRAMAASRFEGKKDQTLTILAPTGIEASRILLVGLGKADKLDGKGAQALGGVVAATLAGTGDAAASLVIEQVEGAALWPADFAAHAGLGARLRSYRFDKYRTKEKKEDKPSLKKLTLLLDDHAEAKRAFQMQEAVAEGVFLTRDLASEPANVIYPESFAKEAEKLAELGVEVEVLGEKEMRKLGMGALLGVGQGSERESKLVVMRWNGLNGKDKDERPVAFVGKGVCFDTGGISIKPSASMEDMKWDMGGAAVVLGAMKTLALRKAKAHVVGICGMVENMPSGTAQRPGDVVTSASGQTIEVINTDAEGRLVLCDALWYVQDRFKPQAIVDLATLTGAIIISLGDQYAGLFSNNDDLAKAVTEAGEATGDKVWRMPMGDAYDKQIKSDIADMKNVGERGAGSITAAQFLLRFIQNDTPWAHIDIAGTTWSKSDSATCPKGATGFGVRLLDQLVAAKYEKK